MKNNLEIKKLLGIPASKLEKFHNATKIKEIIKSDPLKWPKEWSQVVFKEYPRLDSVILPEPHLPDGISLKEVLLRRKSSRIIKSEPMSIDEIGTLLYYSAGLKTYKPPWRANRFHPSGGSRYPLELYLVSLNTELGKNIFHYNIKHHSLEKLSEVDLPDIDKYFNFTLNTEPALILIMTAVFWRTTIKYKDRGYRYILSETGNLSQNFYLLSAALSLGCSAVGYRDDKVNQLLNLNSAEESTVYSMIFGKLPG